MRYLGSKISTLPYLMNIINKMDESHSVADAFGGLGTIGAELKNNGRYVTTCDVLTFPHFFQVAKIEYNALPEFKKLISAYGFHDHEDISNYLGLVE